jgi:hypothetical protein
MCVSAPQALLLTSTEHERAVSCESPQRALRVSCVRRAHLQPPIRTLSLAKPTLQAHAPRSRVRVRLSALGAPLLLGQGVEDHRLRLLRLGRRRLPRARAPSRRRRCAAGWRACSSTRRAGAGDREDGARVGRGEGGSSGRPGERAGGRGAVEQGFDSMAGCQVRFGGGLPVRFGFDSGLPTKGSSADRAPGGRVAHPERRARDRRGWPRMRWEGSAPHRAAPSTGS